MKKKDLENTVAVAVRGSSDTTCLVQAQAALEKVLHVDTREEGVGQLRMIILRLIRGAGFQKQAEQIESLSQASSYTSRELRLFFDDLPSPLLTHFVSMIFTLDAIGSKRRLRPFWVKSIKAIREGISARLATIERTSAASSPAPESPSDL